MLRFALGRLVSLALTLLAAALVIFLVLEVLPGDPAAIMLGTEARPDTLAALRAELGLDRPVLERLALWLGELASGQFGRSYTYDVGVGALILERLAVTLPLAALAFVLSTLLAIPLGAWAAARRGEAPDIGVSLFAQLGLALPNVWLGLLLILAISVGLGWAPAGGFPGWSGGWGAALGALVLPAIALGLPQAAILTRVTRASVIEALGQDHVRTARAMGIRPARVLWRHAVRTALIPVVTILGLQFAFLVAGAVVIENLFTLPGLGRLLFQAIAQRDLIVVRDVTLLFVAITVAVNFLVDLAYGALDPRVQERRGG